MKYSSCFFLLTKRRKERAQQLPARRGSRDKSGTATVFFLFPGPVHDGGGPRTHASPASQLGDHLVRQTPPQKGRRPGIVRDCRRRRRSPQEEEQALGRLPLLANANVSCSASPPAAVTATVTTSPTPAVSTIRGLGPVCSAPGLPSCCRYPGGCACTASTCRLHAVCPCVSSARPRHSNAARIQTLEPGERLPAVQGAPRPRPRLHGHAGQEDSSVGSQPDPASSSAAGALSGPHQATQLGGRRQVRRGPGSGG